MEACGGMLTGTSANISGNPSARTAEDAENQIGKSVDLILDAGTLPGLESTIVKFDDDKITVLRQGPVRVDDAMMRR